MIPTANITAARLRKTASYKQLYTRALHVHATSILNNAVTTPLPATQAVVLIQSLIILFIIDCSILITYPNINHHHHALCSLPPPQM